MIFIGLRAPERMTLSFQLWKVMVMTLWTFSSFCIQLNVTVQCFPRRGFSRGVTLLTWSSSRLFISKVTFDTRLKAWWSFLSTVSWSDKRFTSPVSVYLGKQTKFQWHSVTSHLGVRDSTDYNIAWWSTCGYGLVVQQYDPFGHIHGSWLFRFLLLHFDRMSFAAITHLLGLFVGDLRHLACHGCLWKLDSADTEWCFLFV